MSERGDFGRPFRISSNVVSPPERVKEAGPIALAFTAARRTVLPVLGLLAAILAVFLYGDVRLGFLDPLAKGFPGELLPSQWLRWSLVLVPATFLPLNFTSRRYGPAIAVLSIALAWTIAVASVYAGAPAMAELLRAVPQLPAREIYALIGALIVAQFVAVLAFDASRCIRWWQAPLVASVWGSAVFAGAYYPAAELGTNSHWFSHMAMHFGLMVVESLLLLIPYWMFRSLVRPLPGFAGY